MQPVDAPITAVTVHPSLARVVRTGRATVAAGGAELVVAGLPTSIDTSSVRVAGRSEVATRVVGVDVTARRSVDAPDPRVAAAEAALLDARRALGAVEDMDAGEAARQQLLLAVSDRGGKAFATALASGDAQPDRVAATAAALAEDLEASSSRRRALAERRDEAQRAVDAAAHDLELLRASGRDRRDVVVLLEADGDGEVELELTYVAYGASWQPTYDVRVDGDGGPIALTWGAVISQATGEDWPECEVTVSTSEPQLAASIPELDPWWVGAFQPPPPPVPRMAKLAGGAADEPMPMPMAAAPAAFAVEVAEVEATVLDTTLAAAWRLPRPTAVPSDGAPHRAILANGELEAKLDHVAAPARGTEVHLRATVTNSTGRALVAGQASVFLDDAFVGTAAIEGVAPGGELELALGVDDRVTVEKELARRDDDKKRLSSTRRSSEAWTIEVANHRDAGIHLVVRDRVPTSRHPDVKVVDVKLKPEPAEHDDLGRVEWRTDLAAGATWKADLSFGVEHPKDLPLSGWR